MSVYLLLNGWNDLDDQWLNSNFERKTVEGFGLTSDPGSNLGKKNAAFSALYGVLHS